MTASRRLLRLAGLLLPVLFLLWVFYDGLRCWFIDDDFAWLSLLRQVHGTQDVIRILFEPAAQGTVRPWSERGFFMLFEFLFGFDNLPFRIACFATMALNLVMLNRIAAKIAGSEVAGFAAAVCWAANTALAPVMTWSSVYNEAMSACFLLGAFSLFLRFADTGRRSYWWWQLVVFSLGFGALELNVIYPALAAAYALFVARPERRRALLLSLVPLFAISTAYFLWHRAVAPIPASGPYVVHFDARVFQGIALYGKWALLPANWRGFGHSVLAGKCALWIGITGIAVLLAAEIRRHRTVIFFFIAWYFGALAPVLVLPDHRTDYYLTLPLIGLAMLAGFGITRGAESLGRWRAAALIPLVTYLCVMVPVSRSVSRWTLERTRSVRAIVLGAAAARQKHPDKAIVLNGVTPDLYRAAVGLGAFSVFGLDAVYLTPESAGQIRAEDNVDDPEKLVLDPDLMFHAIKNDQVVIYSVVGDHLRNITEVYELSLSAPDSGSLVRDEHGHGQPAPVPRRVDAGNPLYSYLLGSSWLGPQLGARWMPSHAIVRIAGPESKGSKLQVEGFFPAEQLKGIPRVLHVSVDGISVGEIKISDPESSFSRLLPLPDSVAGKPEMEIGLDAAPVDTVGGQEYGMVFGKFAIRP